jgi:hypothetical protein
VGEAGCSEALGQLNGRYANLRMNEGVDSRRWESGNLNDCL